MLARARAKVICLEDFTAHNSVVVEASHNFFRPQVTWKALLRHNYRMAAKGPADR
jgi:hypothetical protein